MGPMPYSRYILYPIPWYSFLIVLGACVAVFLACREEKRAGLPKDTVIDLALRVIPAGIIGARIYYVIFSWDQFKDDLLSVFRIWEGGIAIYGALIAGLIALILFARRRKLSPLLLCDLLAPGLAFAQGIGRWGNYFNMEAYGLPVTNPALCFFPLAVQIPSGSVTRWHLATFFYESVWDLSVFLFLMLARRKLLRKQGDPFLFYVFLYAGGRLVVEDLRMDSLYSSSIRVSQLLSVLLCVFILLYYIFQARKEGRSLPAAVRFVLLPAAGLYSVFAFLLTVSAATFRPVFSVRYRILLLCGYSALMIICLFAVRFAKARES